MILVVTLAIRSREDQPKNPTAGTAQIANDFKALFLLIISLLHGNLFIALSDRLVSNLPIMTLDQVATFILCYALFFRVLQTQLLAALKYDTAWLFRPFDFLLVFITALFEYIVFVHDRLPWFTSLHLAGLLVGFALFGILGYATTLVRVRRSLRDSERRRETLIQMINIGVLIVIGVGYASAVATQRDSMTALNLVASVLLVLNVYSSLLLSPASLVQR